MEFNTGKSVYCWILLLALVCLIGRCDKLEGYLFPVYNTTSCPRNQSEWRNRSSDLNCTESNGYMCIPNENITQLLEFCYRYPRIPIEKDICLILVKSTSLVEAYNCKQFRNGCPDKQYWSDEIFEYSSCISIGNRCFLAEALCKDKGIATTGPSKTNVYFSSTIINTSLGSTSVPDIDGSNTWVWILVIGIFLITVFILVLVLIIIFRRGKQKNLGEKNTLIEYKDEKQESDGNQDPDEEALLLLANTKTLDKDDFFGDRSTKEIPLIEEIQESDENQDLDEEALPLPENTITLDTENVFGDSSSMKIPEEVLRWDIDSRNRYLDYLKKGKAPIYRARGMIVGCAGAGKTTLLEGLQKKSLEDIQKIKSTVGLDVHNDIFEVLEKEGELKFAVRKYEPAIHIKENVPVDDAEKIEEKKLLSILDFGGQSMYYTCHQIFLSKRAFYILVIDMSKNLEDVVDYELCDQKVLPMFSQWSHRDYLLFWLKCVHCYCGSEAPVILVATHAEGKSEQEKTEYYQELMTAFPESSTIKTHLSSDRYFSLSLKKHNGAYIESVDELERKIVEVITLQKHWGEEIPLDWAIFEKFISEKKETKVQKLDKLKESFDELLPLSRQEFKDLLRFYHDIGVILYFAFKEKMGNDLLHFGLEIVILDIQWFVNSFKYVITDSKQASFNKVIDAAPSREALDTFTTTGEISGTFLKAIWTATKNITAVEYKDDMMKYMERLGLIAIEEKSDICFIPSMNRMRVPENVKSKINSHLNKSPTLYIRFPVLPVFLFYRLIVLCLKRGWNPLRDGRRCIYIDTALFFYQEHVLVFGVSESYIQLMLYDNDDLMQEGSIQRAFINVKREVMTILSSLTKTFDSDLHYQVGYSCTPTEFGKELGNTFITENDLFEYIGGKCPLHAHAENHDVEALRIFLEEDERKRLELQKNNNEEEKLTKSEKEFENELRHGSVEIRQVRIMLVGHYGVGKTTLTYGLIGKDMKGIESTDGIDLFRARCRKRDSNQEWSLVKENYINPAALAVASNSTFSGSRHIIGVTDEKDVFKTEAIENEKHSFDRSSDTRSTTHQTETESATETHTSPDFDSPSHDTPAQNETENANRAHSARPDQSFTKEKSKNNSTNFFKKTKEVSKADVEKRMKEILIDMWDFGGQNVFYTTHQSFLTSRCIYLLVINCAKDLDETIEDRPLHPVEESVSKVEEFIDFWISTITHYTKSKESGFPRIIVIGTHIDEVVVTAESSEQQQHHASERIKKICLQLKEKYKYMKEQLVIEEHLFFNAKDTDKERYVSLREFILKQAESQPHWREPYPKSWLYLLDFIVSQREKGKNIIALQELKEFNRGCNIAIKDSSLENMLQRQHDIGDIIFFNTQLLKHFIILDPSFLIRALKSLISTKDHMSNSSGNMETWENLSTTGVVLEKNIKKIWSADEDLNKHADSLLSVFQHMDIIVKPKLYVNGKEVDANKQEKFFIPCMIDEEDGKIIFEDFLNKYKDRYKFYDISIGNSKEVHELCDSSKKHNLLIPPAIGYRLLSFCISTWPVVEQRLYTACGFFQVDLDHKLILRLYSKCIRVYIVHRTSREDIRPAIYKSVNGTFISFLEACLLQFHENFNVVNGCQELEDNGPSLQNQMVCKEICQGIIEKRQDFVKDVELARLARSIVGNNVLLKLGQELGFSKDEISLIKKQHEKLDQTFYLLHKWRKKGQPTFLVLEQALKKSEIDMDILLKAINPNKDIFEKGMKNISEDLINEVLTDEELDQVAHFTALEYTHLCLELGLTVSEIERVMHDNKNNSLEGIRQLLRKSILRPRGENVGYPTVKAVGYALLQCEGDFHEFCKLMAGRKRRYKVT